MLRQAKKRRLGTTERRETNLSASSFPTGQHWLRRFLIGRLSLGGGHLNAFRVHVCGGSQREGERQWRVEDKKRSVPRYLDGERMYSLLLFKTHLRYVGNLCVVIMWRRRRFLSWCVALCFSPLSCLSHLHLESRVKVRWGGCRLGNGKDGDVSGADVFRWRFDFRFPFTVVAFAIDRSVRAPLVLICAFFFPMSFSSLLCWPSSCVFFFLPTWWCRVLLWMVRGGAGRCLPRQLPVGSVARALKCRSLRTHDTDAPQKSGWKSSSHRPSRRKHGLRGKNRGVA